MILQGTRDNPRKVQFMALGRTLAMFVVFVFMTIVMGVRILPKKVLRPSFLCTFAIFVFFAWFTVAADTSSNVSDPFSLTFCGDGPSADSDGAGRPDSHLHQPPKEREPQEPNPKASTPPSLETIAAKPPKVTYEDGQLTIIAENSSLSEVMRGLRAALGADIDLPASVSSQRIWVHLGPGPARRVLRDLLDGTEFNYVIQASESDEDGIRSVLLTQRAKPTGLGGNAIMAERASRRGVPRGSSEVEGADSDDGASGESVASTNPSQTPPAPPLGNEPPASANLQNIPNNSGVSSTKPASRTSEMIQQLQNMYQQRRQIQMEQNQKRPGQS